VTSTSGPVGSDGSALERLMSPRRLEEMWTIVVAAGRSERFGDDKQAALLGGTTVLDHSIAAAAHASAGVVVVVSPDRVAPLTAEPPLGADVVVAGGSTRAGSVRSGLAAVPPTAGLIAVHDGARPMASPELWGRCRHALDDPGVDGAVPALAVTDTLKRIADDGAITATVDRGALVAVQTPQVFRAELLRRAHGIGGDATDDARLVEAAGGRVVVVAGDEVNRKVTTREDLAVLAAMIGSRPSSIRVGHGFDSHALSADPTRPLLLGGVRFEGERGLAGHSDADAVCHALADAILSGAGLDDLGSRYSDSDPRWEGADSVELLVDCVAAAASAGWVPTHAVATVVCRQPRLAPRRREMSSRLAKVLGCEISITGKTPEGLAGVDASGTVACWAVVTLHPRLAP